MEDDLWIIFAENWNSTVRARSLTEALDKATSFWAKYNDGVWPRMKIYKIVDGPQEPEGMPGAIHAR